MICCRPPNIARHPEWTALTFLPCIGWALAFGSWCAAQEPGQNAPVPVPVSEQQSVDRIRSFVTRHCVECHRGEQAKRKLRLDQLAFALKDEADRKAWHSVLQQLQEGTMPPPSKPRPAADELRDVSSLIATRLAAAMGEQRARQGRVVLRRLNRGEYENTVRDLLLVNSSLQDMLPIDTASHGFDNVGDALHTSSFLLERYLEAADIALNQAIANRPQPPVIKRRYSLTETHQVKSTTERVHRKSDDGRVVLFSSSPWQAVGLSPFYPPDRGSYRFRISASAIQSSGKPIVFRVLSGGGGMGGAKPHLVNYFDAPADASTVIEFIDYMEPRTSISILPYGLPAAQVVDKIGAETYDGPGLAIDWIEVEGPLNDVWPPESHRRMFGDLAQVKSPIYNDSTRVEVVSQAPQDDARRILRTFARRAFRRSVKDAELQPYLDLVQAKLDSGQSFELAMRVGLSAVMISPEFLFLREAPGRLDDFALASRLSYFLWSSMPDDALLDLAEAGKLSQPEVLRAQVERLLQHPRAEAFTRNFVGQWLRLRDIDFTVPSHILYPDFDDMLQTSMVRETELFFTELLKDDLSLTNFIASDFTMLNGRLAKHYGIPGVEGFAFHKTTLPAGSHRGGVLTMASVLKVTANGTSTSPVVRGAWVLDRILGIPPPKPPENIAALEPDTRGATTIREQLARHREIESCAGCHRLIDPPGFALESFDVIGGWREYYRTTGNGKPVTVDGRRMHYLQGPKVDPADVLLDGRAFQNSDELKQLLLADKDQFARSLTTKLLTYATGGAPEVVDQPQIDAIVATVREQNYGFRSLVHAIVASELFRNK